MGTRAQSLLDSVHISTSPVVTQIKFGDASTARSRPEALLDIAVSGQDRAISTNYVYCPCNPCTRWRQHSVPSEHAAHQQTMPRAAEGKVSYLTMCCYVRCAGAPVGASPMQTSSAFQGQRECHPLLRPAQHENGDNAAWQRPIWGARRIRGTRA